MNNPPPTKSLTAATSQPHAAPQPVGTTAVGEPKGPARKGVPTAPRSDPQRENNRRITGWLHIRAPYGAQPSALSTCECGRHLRAFGERRVLALIEDHEAHGDACPLRSPKEGRTAA
ncbi:hypothetical protein ABZ568_09195 [Streptomyces olindensis]|uniref:Uncharacterized protein n=1 Tax=Streptomyces olindensis TaxID=358823 RepID=A0ABV2XRG2_9ACTN